MIVSGMVSALRDICLEELFGRLAEGHGARLSVVTPNRRLAQTLQRDFDTHQRARGLAVWETADILPWAAFSERLWEDALYSELATAIPLLLAPAQEQALWEEVLGQSRFAAGLLSVASAAAQCRDAWQLAQAWRLMPKLRSAEANEDVRAFLDWASRYEAITHDKGLCEPARLPDVVAGLLAHEALRKPRTVVVFGFDIETPQTRDSFAALAAAGVELLASRASPREGRAWRVELASHPDEVLAAAKWARARLEGNPAARVGVVIPDLAKCRASVRRAFATVMQPEHLLPGAEKKTLPIDISIGLPLAHYALVDDALRVLRLAGRETAFEEASRLIRSPFTAGAETEMSARALLDARLRERAAAKITLDQLNGLLVSLGGERAPVLAERLSRLAEFRKRNLFGAKAPSDWAQSISEALDVAGFPGERALDSAEYQTLKKWYELLAGFAALERVTGKMRYPHAIERLARMATDTLFQPETPEAPIAILGILESAGLTFDHLWVMGLTDEAWPLAPRPHPFLPVRLQREAGVPEADVQSSLALDRRITANWLAAAPEVVVSHARMKDDAELSPSPLIASIGPRALEDLGIPAYASLRDALQRARCVECISDAMAPPITRIAREGGTDLFRDQAACPFRGFARHRLGSAPLTTPQPGLNAKDRGTLLHGVLAAAWNELKRKANLDAIGADELSAILDRAAEEAIGHVRRRRPGVLEGHFAAIERERLIKLALDWLAFEKRRGDFEVVATERELAVTFGGLTVNARLDRLDRLSQGGYALLDYKTGHAHLSAWLGERPDEPQLPMYALSAEEEVAAIAFARLRPGRLEFCGVAQTEGLLPKARTIGKSRSKLARRYADWQALRQGWERELDALGRSFAEGCARVDPKHGAQSCRNCDQSLFCRIAEKSPLSFGPAPSAGESVDVDE